MKLIIGDKEIYGISRGIDAQGALLLEQDGVIKAWWVVKYHCAVQNKKGSFGSLFYLRKRT